MSLRIGSKGADLLYDGPSVLGMAYDFMWMVELNVLSSLGWFRAKPWDESAASQLVKSNVLRERILKEGITLYYPGDRWDEFISVMDGWKDSWCPY